MAALDWNDVVAGDDAADGDDVVVVEIDASLPVDPCLLASSSGESLCLVL